jgi:hypothetical protein
MAWRKMDDDMAQDDWVASAFIPIRMRANLAANYDERMMSGGRTFRQTSGDDYAPVVSTHPDYWLSIPLLIPNDRTAETLNVVVSCAGETNDTMSFRLAVNGNTGSTTTLSTTSNTSTTVSVDYTPTAAAWAIASLQIKSGVGSSAGGVSIYNTRQGALLVEDVSLGPTAGRNHYLIDIDTFSDVNNTDTVRTRHYVGRIENSTDAPYSPGSFERLTVWPTPPAGFFAEDRSGTAKDSATVYDLAAYTIYGISWYYSGSGTGYPGISTFHPGEEINAASVRGLMRAQRELYVTRRRCVGMGPTQTSDGLMGALVLDTSTTVDANYFELRPDVTGISCAFYAQAIGTRNTSTPITATLNLAEVGGSTRSVTQTFDVPAEPPRYDPGRGGSMTQHNLAQERSEWGMWDLGSPDEHAAGTGYGALLEMTIGLPSGAVAGDTMAATLVIDGDYIYVGAVTMMERIHTRGL